MSDLKTLKQHCQECPTFAEKLKRIVLSEPFDGVQYRVGGSEKGTWLHKARNAFIQGKKQ